MQQQVKHEEEEGKDVEKDQDDLFAVCGWLLQHIEKGIRRQVQGYFNAAQSSPTLYFVPWRVNKLHAQKRDTIETRRKRDTIRNSISDPERPESLHRAQRPVRPESM